MPYMRIGGRNLFPPPIVSYLQTDGSFHMKTKLARAAFILKTPTYKYAKMLELQNVIDSTETEWASITYGIAYSFLHGQFVLAVENDNLGVVSSIITNANVKQDYARHYQHEIYKMAQQSIWLGLRWIPRKENKADMLFKTLK